MKTRTLFAFVFWLGVVMLLTTAAIELSGAVWQEVQISQTKSDEQLSARLTADEAQSQTIATTNDNLGKPGLVLLIVGALGWFVCRLIEEVRSTTQQRQRLKESAQAAAIAEGIKNAKIRNFHHADLQRQFDEAAAAGRRISRT